MSNTALITRAYFDNINPSGSDEDFANMNKRITGLIEDYLHAELAVSEHVDEILDENGILIPNNLPISQLESMYKNSGSGFELLTENIDFFVEDDHIELVNLSTILGRRNVKLTYKAGFDSIAEPIYSVAEELARYSVYTSDNPDLEFYKKQNADDIQLEPRADMSETKILHKLKKYMQYPSGSKKSKGGVKVWAL